MELPICKAPLIASPTRDECRRSMRHALRSRQTPGCGEAEYHLARGVFQRRREELLGAWRTKGLAAARQRGLQRMAALCWTIVRCRTFPRSRESGFRQVDTFCKPATSLAADGSRSTGAMASRRYFSRRKQCAPDAANCKNRTTRPDGWRNVKINSAMIFHLKSTA